MNGSQSAPGFWLVVGRAVDDAEFLGQIKKKADEDDEAWRRRLERLGEGSIRPNREDSEALTRRHNGQTIIDLIEQCKSGWPNPTSPSTQASYRT